MITFARKTDGTFDKQGELNMGTRKVRIDRDDPVRGYVKGMVSYPWRDGVAVVEQAIADGKAPASTYYIIETEVDSLDVMETRAANLKKARSKKAEIAEAQEVLERCPLCGHTDEHADDCMNRGIKLGGAS